MSSREKIINATYTVLQQEGFSGLSIRKIAKRADVNKSLIYHHFDSKKDLISEFLDVLMLESDSDYNQIISAPEDEMLDKLIEASFNMEHSKRWKLEKALLEIQAQASKDKELSNKLRKLDEKLLENTTHIYQKLGSKNPSKDAEIYLSLVHGAIGRKAALQDLEGLKKLESEIKKVMSERLN